MSLPDYMLTEVGTPITWKSSGGTYALTLTSVTTGNGRQGAKGDLGQYRAKEWAVLFSSAVGSAVTAPNQELELWWANSDSPTAGTNNPGGTSGTDATFNTAPTEYTPQLQFIGSLMMSNNAGTAVQSQWFKFTPLCRYGMPVVRNATGQTLSGTAGNHQVQLTPNLDGGYDTPTG